MQTVRRTDGRSVRRTTWWRELLIIGAFYALYSVARNLFGSTRLAADGVPLAAFHNAERVIRWEQAIGLYHEATVQSWFLGHPWFVQFWNAFYGTAHFAVTIGVLVVLYARRPDVYRRWRTTLAGTTALAIIGFSLFPLMPPRLLDAPCPGNGPVITEYGGACIPSELRMLGSRSTSTEEPRGPAGQLVAIAPRASFGFVDTLAEYGGPWSFESDTMLSISNQYAAMPSLHIGWASWSALALFPIARRRVARVLLLLYPAATLFCIVVTANHFWLDGVGGLVVLAGGYTLARLLERWPRRRHGTHDLRPQTTEAPLVIAGCVPER